MNYYQHHLGDYAKDTGHLSLLEHGAYRLLLDHCYSTEKPLPSSPAALCRICRAATRAERDAVAAVAAHFFREADGLLFHKRVEREIEAYSRARERNTANGKLGGRPRKYNNNTQNPNSNPNQNKSPKEPDPEPVGFFAGFPAETGPEPNPKPYQPPTTTPQPPVPAARASSEYEHVPSRAWTGPARTGGPDPDSDTNMCPYPETEPGTNPPHPLPGQSASTCLPPVTLKAAIEAGAAAGFTSDISETWWLDHDARGWLDTKGQPIRNWRSSLTAYGRRWQANDAARAAATRYSPRSPAVNHEPDPNTEYGF